MPKPKCLPLQVAKDILLAYQPTFPKAERFLKLSETYPDVKFSCLIDNLKSAKSISQIFKNKQIEVYIDLNVGMNRTGILPENALDLVKDCEQLNALKIVGLHAYDGHVEDREVLKRKLKVKEIYHRIFNLKDAIEKDLNFHISIVVGGTPTFYLYAELDKSLQVSPGTFVFWDNDYDKLLPDLDFKFAAVLITRIVSIIDRNTICIDLGHKSVSSENPFPRVNFLDEREIYQKSHSEEHMVPNCC